MPNISANLKIGSARTLGVASILLAGFVFIVGIIAGMFGGIFLGSRQSDQWQQRYIEFELKARVAQIYADSLQSEVGQLVVIADSLSTYADRQSSLLQSQRQVAVATRAENEALYQEVISAAMSDPCNCEPVINLAERLRSEVQENLREINMLYARDELRLQEIETLRTALTLQTQRADSLAVVVRNIPTPRGQFKLFGFDISRRDAALAGTIVGVVLGGIAF